MDGRNHMNGLKRKEEVHERDGSVETKEREVSNGREELKRKERCSKWKGSVKRKERSNAPGIRVSNII